jgi:hypothetical protein
VLPHRLLGTNRRVLCFGVVLMAAVWAGGFAPAICFGCAQWLKESFAVVRAC